MPFIAGSLCLGYIGLFGIFFNLVFFFQEVFDQGSGIAASSTNNCVGSTFLSGLLGAFIAESFLGRLWTCTLFQGIATVGFALMMISTYVVLSAEQLTGTMVVFFYISIYIVAIGSGVPMSILQALGADQFDSEKDKSTFFTWCLISTSAGAFLADTVVVYAVSSKGWFIGFGVASIFGAAGLILFASGIPLYRHYRHQGNPYRRALQVLIAAARKCRIKVPTNSDDLYQEVQHEQGCTQLIEHTDDLRWLDKAATVLPCDNKDGRVRNVWKLSTVTEVEEMKALLRLIPIWTSGILYNTIYSQSSTLLVEEGALMDLSIAGSVSMQPATMNLFNLLVAVFVDPLYNAVVVPLARSITGLPHGLSSLHRIGIGCLTSSVAMMLAGALEFYRLHCFKQGLPPISIFCQIPVYFMLGLAQFLACIGLSEFLYSYAPLSLRSFGTSLSCACGALGLYVSSLLVWIVTLVTARGEAAGWIPADLNDGHLDYFFWLLGGLGFLNFFWFIGCS
ncbi:hypothetical protein KP509_1Z172800, partial [Ceratopteris richardii]